MGGIESRANEKCIAILDSRYKAYTAHRKSQSDSTANSISPAVPVGRVGLFDTPLRGEIQPNWGVIGPSRPTLKTQSHFLRFLPSLFKIRILRSAEQDCCLRKRGFRAMRQFRHLVPTPSPPYRALVKFRGEVFVKRTLDISVTNDSASINELQTNTNSAPNHPEFFCVAASLRGCVAPWPRASVASS